MEAAARVSHRHTQAASSATLQVLCPNGLCVQLLPKLCRHTPVLLDTSHRLALSGCSLNLPHTDL